MADFEGIAKQFVEFYYKTFDDSANRSQLTALYRATSMLTFENSPVQGAAAIVEKLGALPFQRVEHRVDTLDAQPSVNNGIVVVVSGALLVDEEKRPMSYVQMFQLLPEGESYYVHNDVFRLVYPSA